MEKQDADDLEYQTLVLRHKADIEASGMSQEELIDLLARNLATHNLMCRIYESNCRLLKNTLKIREEICDLLKDRSADGEQKLLAAVNAIPQAIQAGMEAGGRALVSSAGRKGASKKHAPARELKEWALQEGAKMRGTHMDIAKHLSQRVPPHLATVSADPKRFIYDTVRQQKKQAAPKAPRGFVPLTRSRQP